jgi:hydroxyacylglutathione hydrolase
MEIHKMVFSPIEVNTYILMDESGDCAVIDCGCYNKREFEQMAGFLDRKNVNPVLLLNTHCHLDHIFGNGFLFEKYGIKTLSSELEEPNRVNSVQHAMLFGLTMDVPPAPGGYIIHNQSISFGTTDLIALHVPGHSPGSLAFYSEKDNSVFTGDALFKASIGRTDLPGGDHETLLESIKNRLFVLPPSTIVYPGHGDKTTILAELQTNPFFV